MSFDLTNKNIKDTFQNLLQRTGSDNRLYDLTGNQITDLRINGNLIADQYIVSSSVTNVTTLTQSGSTQFGNSSDDTHTFTGNITASGNISASGLSHVFGNAFIDNPASGPPSGFVTIGSDNKATEIYGSVITALGTKDNRLVVTLSDSEFKSTIPFNVANSITASGDISSSGTIHAGTKYNLNGNTILSHGVGGFALGNDNLGTNLGGSSITTAIAPLIIRGNITASGNISASGTSHTFGNGVIRQSTGFFGASAIDIGSDNKITFIKGKNLLGLGTVNTDLVVTIADESIEFSKPTTVSSRLKTTSHITASGDISASGDVIANKVMVGGASGSVDGITVDGEISSSGNIRGSTFFSNGEGVIFASGDDIFLGGVGTNLVQAPAAIKSFTGLITDGHITASGNISSSGTANTFGGTSTFGGNLFIPDVIKHVGATNNSIGFTDTNTITLATEDRLDFTAGGTIICRITSTGANFNSGDITASGGISSSGAAFDIGERIRIGGKQALLYAGGSEEIRLGNNTQNTVIRGATLETTANITASGNISGSSTSTLSMGGQATFGSHITASGNISSSGNVIGTQGIFESLDISGNIDVDGTTNSDGISNVGSFGTSGGDVSITSDNIQIRKIGGGTLANTPSTVHILGDLTTSQITSSIISASGTIVSNVMTPTTITNVNTTHITASGNISSSLDVGANNIKIKNKDSMDLDSTTLRVGYGAGITGIGIGRSNDLTRNINLFGPVTASGDISASGTIVANELQDASLTAGRVVFVGTDGVLTDDSDLTFSTDTLTTTKIGAFEAAGAIDFSDEAMTNVNIDSGVIDGTVIGGASAAAGTFTTLNATSLNVTSITSSIVTSSILQTEGSNIFGDTIADTHTFNGHITASGNISASGDVFGVTGSFKNLTVDDITIEGSKISDAGDFTIDVEGDISVEATGKDISFTNGVGTPEFIFNLETAPELDVDGDFTIDGSGLIKLDSATERIDLVGNVTASGNISASGKLNSNKLLLNNSNNSDTLQGTSEGVTYKSNNHKFIGHITASGNISGSSTSQLFMGGNSIFDNQLVVGTHLTVNGTSNLNGDVNLGNALADDVNVKGHMTASGNISSSGDIVATGTFVNGITDVVGRHKLNGTILCDEVQGIGTLGGLVLTAASSQDISFNEGMSTVGKYDGGDNQWKFHQPINLGPISGDVKLTLDLNGNISSSGHITASGNISGSSTSTLSVGGQATLGGINSTSHITASGTISASGGGHIFGGSGAGSLDVQGTITSSGNISASGDVIAETGSFGRLELVGGAVSLKNQGVQSYINFYCESNNAHFVKLQAPAHSDFSGNVTVTLPATTDTLVGKTTTDTLTNKTLTSPDINTPDIDNGTIDGTAINNAVIGGSTPAAGSFTTVVASNDITANGNIAGDNSTTISGISDITTLGNSSFGNAIADTHTITGNITASANISASGDGIFNRINVGGGLFTSASLAAGGSGGGSSISVASDGANRVLTSDGDDTFTAEAGLSFDGTTLTVDGNLTLKQTGSLQFNLFSTSSNAVGQDFSAAGQAQGDIVKFGVVDTGTMVAGKVYYLNTSKQWVLTNASTDANGADELLAVALGDNPAVHGMLLRGVVSLQGVSNVNAVGVAIYMATTDGIVVTAAPNSNNNIVRVLGYALSAANSGASSELIYFNPGTTFVKITA